MSSYVEHKLNSGLIVNIRPMSWEEFWKIGEKRLEAIDAANTADTLAARKQALQMQRDLAELPFEMCIKNFDDDMSKILSRHDVHELQNIINTISTPEIERGNLSPVADTTPTES